MLATGFKLSKNSTTLLVIGMQTSDLGYGCESEFGRKYPNMANYWNMRIEEIVLPNVKMLIDVFRRNKLKVVFIKSGTMVQTEDRLTPRLKDKIRLCGHSNGCYKGKYDYEIVEQLAPKTNDLIIGKLNTGAFTATLIDHILRNINITDIVITGILTDMCVLDTARTAAELGYNVMVCEDACATLTPRAHNDALLMHARTVGKVATATEIIDELTKS